MDKKIITVKDLIKKLNELDPTGNMKVMIDTTGCEEYEELVVDKVKPLDMDEEIIAIDANYDWYDDTDDVLDSMDIDNDPNRVC